MATKNYRSECNKEALYFLFILVRKKIKTLNDERLKDTHKRNNVTSKQRFEIFQLPENKKCQLKHQVTISLS